jgi:hypothetical protein
LVALVVVLLMSSAACATAAERFLGLVLLALLVDVVVVVVAERRVCTVDDGIGFEMPNSPGGRNTTGRVDNDGDTDADDGGSCVVELGVKVADAVADAVADGALEFTLVYVQVLVVGRSYMTCDTTGWDGDVNEPVVVDGAVAVAVSAVAVRVEL